MRTSVPTDTDRSMNYYGTFHRRRPWRGRPYYRTGCQTAGGGGCDHLCRLPGESRPAGVPEGGLSGPRQRFHDPGTGGGGDGRRRGGGEHHRPAPHWRPLSLRGHSGADGRAGPAGHLLRRDPRRLLLLRSRRRPLRGVYPAGRITVRYHHPHGGPHAGAGGGAAAQAGRPRLHHGALFVHRSAGAGGKGAGGGRISSPHSGGHRVQSHLAGGTGIPLHGVHPGPNRPGKPHHQDSVDYNW